MDKKGSILIILLTVIIVLMVIVIFIVAYHNFKSPTKVDKSTVLKTNNVSIRRNNTVVNEIKKPILKVGGPWERPFNIIIKLDKDYVGDFIGSFGPDPNGDSGYSALFIQILDNTSSNPEYGELTRLYANMFQIVAPPKYINERYNVIFDKSINDSNFREGDQIFSMPKEKLDSYIIDRNPIIESYICNGTNQKDFAEKLSGGIMPPECRTASEIVENGFKF